MVSLSNAKLYAKVGTAINFEIAWMDELVATNPAMLVVDCSHGVTLQEMTVPDEDEPAGSIDPHIWTSPRNAAIMVQNIAGGLIQVDPSNQSYYEQNRDAYLQEIDKLDTDIRNGLAGARNRVFMVYHPAFGYFAAEYGLAQLPIEAEGKEPTAAGLQHLIEQAKEYDIKVVFAEPQFNPQSAEVIANEIGGQVILIDPLAEDYLSNMRTVAEKMIAAME
jgi:zinc transport system substrate-binding protein